MDLFKPKKKEPAPDHAFPFQAVVPADPAEGRLQAILIIQQGMTLRDYFAARAMSAQIGTDSEGGMYITKVERIAERAYQMANAMLAERSKNENV